MLKQTVVLAACLAAALAQSNSSESKNNLQAYRVQAEFYGTGVPCFTSNTTQRRLQTGGTKQQANGDTGTNPNSQLDDNRFATNQRPSVLIVTSGICQVVPDSPGNSFQVNCDSNGQAGSAYFCSDTACQNCRPVVFQNGNCFQAPVDLAGAANIWKLQCYNPYTRSPNTEQGPRDLPSGAGATGIAMAAITAAGAAALAAL